MTDISTISLAINSLKNATDIVSFFRSSDLSFEKAEAKMKLADLMSALADVKMQLSEVQQAQLDKDKKIKELEVALNAKSNLIYEAPYYWGGEGENREGPFCQQCYDSSQKLVRLQNGGYSKGYWGCATCKNTFKDSSYTPTKIRNANSGSSSWMKY